jgi:hypothetical protein
MRIQFVMCLCLLVFAACSVDAENPTDTATTQNDATTDAEPESDTSTAHGDITTDTEPEDTTSTCKPWRETCPCDPKLYNSNGDPMGTPIYECCVSSLSFYSCRYGNWTGEQYEKLLPCPSEKHPVCPFAQ